MAIVSVLFAFSIPLFNILAVIALTIYNKNEDGSSFRVRDILKKISRNPLILGVLAGLMCLVVRAIMAGEMSADEELAGQLVVWTSIWSIITIFLIVVVTKTLGFI